MNKSKNHYGPDFSKAVKNLTKSFKKKSSIEQDKIIGKVEYHKEFHSAFLGTSRDIIVRLPLSYSKKNEQKYPVLYMHDGQNLMDPKTSFAGIDWRVDENVFHLIKEAKIEEIIVVGVYNTPDRLSEYSDSEKGQKYMKFLSEELKPFIDSKYKTLLDRLNTAVMGSSMGGLISLLSVWYYPNVFSKAACLSSSFHYEEEKAIKMIRDYEGEKKEIKIYIDSGEDGKIEAQKMFCALTAKGFVIGKDLDYYYSPGSQHHESEWAKRLDRPLLFLFGKKQPAP
jgi:predicted alpha/beta superfamily hydrolase